MALIGSSAPSGRVARLLALLALFVILSVTAARADVAAGQQAFDKGDYARAMSEWQSAADKGDADGQLGLGKLYEFGLGDLAQNYKRADFWYRKAADQNSAEAEYRLMLIWAVGGDDFPPDLAEAYKWLTLVAESKGVWGTRASEVKPQFDRLVGLADQAKGKKLAADWKDERAKANADTPNLTAQTPTSTTPSPGLAPGSGSCANWPFPGLPCVPLPSFPGAKPAVPPPVPPNGATGQPPSQPAPTPAAPAPSSEAPLDQLNKALAQIDCAARPQPLCHSLTALNAIRLAGLLAYGNLSIQLANGATQLHEGDLIQVEVHGPVYPVNLRIDYFSLGGQVLHLWPNNDEEAVSLTAGQTRIFGQPGAHKVWAAGGSPFGTEFISVIATSASIDLGAVRRPVEPAEDYLRDLRAALGRSSANPSRPNIAAVLMVHTSAH
jgi:hypothetical protein